MPVQVPLTNGYVAIVDEADHGIVIQHRWYAKKMRVRYYAATNVRDGGERRTVFLHHLILGERPGPGLFADHKNGNTMDDRRENLRWATRGQNKQNAKRHKNAGSRFKGVHRRPAGRWAARITVNGHRRVVGTFATEEEAAVAYDRAAREHFGEFARTNGGR